MVDMNICAIVVTYGDRFTLLQQVVNELLNQPVYSIIVISNNSAETSRRGLMEMEKRLGERLKVIYLPENTGSARGYSIGMQEANRCADCEFLWLLDDDNLPERGALEFLIEAWKAVSDKSAESRLALASYRETVDTHRRILAGENFTSFINRNNYFLGFHAGGIFSKIKSKICRPGSRRTSEKTGNLLTLPYTVYGGLFFHKKLLDAIGYPDEDYFLYGDDHDFTFRVTKNGGRLLLISRSKITDIDRPWLCPAPGQGHDLPTLLRGNDQNRVYYCVRNYTVFDVSHFKKNAFSYTINKYAYLAYLWLFAVVYRRKMHFETILRAVNDGEKMARRKTSGS